MKKLLTIMAVLGLVVAVQPAAAALSENFESGYNIGALDGQNGWVNLYGAGLSVNNTYGKGGGWGAYATSSSWAGSKKAHGEPMTNGDVLTLEFDTFATSPPAQSRIGLRGDGAAYLLVGFNFGDTGSIAFEGSGTSAFALDSGSMNVKREWHHVELTWTIGSSAEVKVWDVSDTLVYSPGAQTYTGLEDLSNVILYTRYGSINAFDNIDVSEIPEPATFAVLCLGALGFLIRRRR